MRVPVHARVGSLCEAPLVAMVTLIVSGLQTANGNVEAKVVCFYRRRDISSTLIALADKHASEWPTITQPKSCNKQNCQPGHETFLSDNPLQSYSTANLWYFHIQSNKISLNRKIQLCLLFGLIVSLFALQILSRGDTKLKFVFFYQAGPDFSPSSDRPTCRKHSISYVYQYGNVWVFGWV